MTSSGKVSGEASEAWGAQSTVRRKSKRRHHTCSDAKVVVHPDGTLSLEQLRREEARLLVETAISAASSRSWSPWGEDGADWEQEDTST
ncbi:hypothetical protein NDU88_002387 [Pleurodeles waltl]|uniref:Uncharacterized protein n=1 Tax=Pleurodeles waltl TaxID=8319 RepID=A0AAV7PF50_PLEWA|nr:hypothetical protein NDU88_002387 [Pleurodeles waltl]